MNYKYDYNYINKRRNVHIIIKNLLKLKRFSPLK